MRLAIWILGAVMSLTTLSCQFCRGGEVDQLLQSGVVVKTKNSYGSGTIVNRYGRTFILTAGHVVDSEIKDETDADNRCLFRRVKGTCEILQDQCSFAVNIVKYSPLSQYDLAVLELNSDTVLDADTKFASKDAPLGMEVYHVGRFWFDPLDRCSVTEGIISRLDYSLDQAIFSQTTAVTFPGSSGGGIFRKSDGRYVGMLVRGVSSGAVGLITPISRIRQWAKDEDIEWLVKPTREQPATSWKLQVERR
jgi:S1-C subfamily serine protease